MDRQFTKDIGKMINQMEEVDLYFPTVPIIMEIGLEVNMMVKESIVVILLSNFKEIGKKVQEKKEHNTSEIKKMGRRLQNTKGNIFKTADHLAS